MMALPSRLAEPEGSAPRYRVLVTAWKRRTRELIGRVPVSIPEEHRRAYGLTLARISHTIFA